MHRNTRRCLQVRSLVVCWHHILTFSFVYKFIDHLQRERYHSLSVVRLFTYFWASATHLISRWGIMCLTCPSVCSCMGVPAEACHQLLVCFFAFSGSSAIMWMYMQMIDHSAQVLFWCGVKCFICSSLLLHVLNPSLAESLVAIFFDYKYHGFLINVPVLHYFR